MVEYNKLLKRQIKKHLGKIPDECSRTLKLLNAISESYDHYEEDRNLLERSNRISSDELEEKNQQLAVAKDGLEERVKERTRELEVATHAALAASEAKSQFLANMSHEIRTPLNAIIGYSQILISDLTEFNIPDQLNRYLENIINSGNHLTKMIEDILDLSKIEAGKISISMEDINIESLVQNTYQIFQATAQDQGVEFLYSFDPSLPKIVQSDASRLNQVLTNLLSNAFKFTPPEKMVILKAKREGDFMLFIVEDQGIGIAKERQDAVFQIFEQADNSTTRNYGGTGLGLAITMNIVNTLDGDITLESEQGKGTIFTVKLPILESKRNRQGEVDSQVKALGDIDPEATVLVVEDNPLNQEMAMELLRKFGVRHIHIANDGMEGLEKTHELQPDLILTDVHMPRMDGLEYARAVRESNIDEINGIPIVVLSANAFASQRDRAVEIGIDDYLTKPVNHQRLKEVILRYLV